MPALTKVMLTENRFSRTSLLVWSAAILLAALSLCQRAGAQEIAMLQPDAPQPAAALQPAPLVRFAPPAKFAPTAAPTEVAGDHRFWDRENSLLFATSAAFSAADFVVTRDNLRSGGQELNPVTRLISGTTTGLAVNFAGETAGVIGLSYFFHKTGHHRMERAVSMLNIGASGAAVTYDLAHR